MCSKYLKGKLIPVRQDFAQHEIDSQLGRNLATLRSSVQMTAQCEKYGIPALCYHFFPGCDPIATIVTSRLCRSDCEKLYQQICKQEIALVIRYSPDTQAVLPNCSTLLEEGMSGRGSCIPLGLKGKRAKAAGMTGEPDNEADAG